MLATILNAFQVPDIRKKIAFTAGMLLIYRLGSHIPVPGVNLTAVNNIQKQLGGNNILGLLNLFSGGSLSRIAIFALGIMPYITSSIILQLLQVVVPSLEKLSKEGEVGQARITQYTRYLTVGLAFAQSIGYVVLFHSLQFGLVADDLALVENNEDDQPNGKCQHSDRAEEKHNGNITGVSDF